MRFGLPASPGPNTRRRRRNQALLWIGSGVLALALLAVVNGWADAWGVPTRLQQAVIILVAVALTILTVLHWHSLDEVGRRLHSEAFFWSGMLSWAAVLVLMGVTAADGVALSPLFPVFGSAFLVIGLHAVLYLLFYAASWLRTRLP